ncbi:hypothetical protein D6853_11080 [Butyrivibrio sp. X503]|nr:hypothetical protein D6853_11080 [Butyrivibrio sp. X503]
MFAPFFHKLFLPSTTFLGNEKPLASFKVSGSQNMFIYQLGSTVWDPRKINILSHLTILK